MILISKYDIYLQCEIINHTNKDSEMLKFESNKRNKMEKITLKGYYESLGNPQKELRETIATKCGVTMATVYRWLNGESTPSKLQREMIAKIMKVKSEDLNFGTDNEEL